MRVRYQGGYLRLGQRKKGPDRWEFPWWDFEANGTRVRRKAIIGTVKQYPNLENAWQASNGLRVSINETRNRQREQTNNSCRPCRSLHGDRASQCSS
jgi:hypothetical protein